MLKSDESVIATPIQKFPSRSHLQKIIQYAKNLPTPTITTAAPVTVYSPIHTDPWCQTESQTDFEFAHLMIYATTSSISWLISFI